MMPEVRDIVEEYLTKHVMDGLYSSLSGCACEKSDLMPCDRDSSGCQPGYKVPCPKDGECECDYDSAGESWHIQAEKPEEGGCSLPVKPEEKP